MPDFSDFASNPYLAAALTPQQPDWKQTLSNALVHMGAGIAGASASGQPWFGGIAPGLARGYESQQQEAAKALQQQMMLGHLAMQGQEYQDKRDERAKAERAAAAWVASNPTGDATGPVAGPPAPGITVPNAPQLGPRVAAPQSGGVNDNNIGNVRPPGASTGFQQPPDFDSGVGLTISNARSYPRTYNGGQPMTLAQIGSRWAPIGSADDPTGLNKNWVPNVAKFSGLDPNAPLDLSDPATATAFVRGVHGAEKGGQAIRPPEAYAAGIAKGLPGFQIPGMPTPAGVVGASPMPSGGLPPGASIGLPPAVPPVPSAPPLPPFMGPGMPSPGFPSASAPQPNVVQGGSEAPTPQVIPAQFTPPPQLAPPPEPPVVPRPTQLPRDEQNALNNMVMTRQITPHQAETEKNKRINELWSDQKTVAREKWTQQREDYRFNRGEANKTDTVTPLSDKEAAELGLPGNLKYQRSKSGKIEQIGNSKQPTYEDIKDASGNIIGQRESGSNKLSPVNLPTPSDNPNGLTGPAFLETLPKDRAAQLAAYKEGRLTLSPRLQASKEGKQVMSDLFNAYPDDYDAIVTGSRQKTLNAFTSGTESKTITAFNTTIQHLGELQKQGGALQNISEGFGPLNQTVNMLRNKSAMGSGEVPIAKFEATKHAVIEEASKAFRGIGQSDSEIKAWGDKISSSQTPDQMQGVIEEMVGLLNGKIESLGHQYNQGMGVSKAPLELLSPKARETLDYIRNNPIAHRGANEDKNASMQPKNGDPLEGRTISSPGKPTLIRRNGQWVPQ